jgi:hypothetical protein
MAPCKLLTALEEAGLDDDKLDWIQYELDMDADADDDEENEEHEDAEQLGSGDSEDNIGEADTSSTVHNTPTPFHPATRKRNAPPKTMNKMMMMVHACILNFKVVLTSIIFTAPSEPSKTITYILSIISHSEAKKTVSKHIPIGRWLELQLDEPWDTLQAQILIQIDIALHPSKIKFSDYNISFTIACTVFQPLPLNSVANYSFLVLQTTKGKSVLTVKITCEQMVGRVRAHLMVLCEYMLIDTHMPTKDGKNKENENDRNDQSDDESGNKKKKKSNVSLSSSCCSLLLTTLTGADALQIKDSSWKHQLKYKYPESSSTMALWEKWVWNLLFCQWARGAYYVESQEN